MDRPSLDHDAFRRDLTTSLRVLVAAPEQLGRPAPTTRAFLARLDDQEGA